MCDQRCSAFGAVTCDRIDGRWWHSGVPQQTHKREGDSGVSSEGLMTTALPAANGNATILVSNASGALYGETTATTPTGSRNTIDMRCG